MSKTFKTDPADVQIRRQMKADPYRSTEKNGVHSRMLYRNKYSSQYDVIFRSNEVSQMEAFLSMLDNNKDTTTTQHSTRRRRVITYKVKSMNGYLETAPAYTYSYSPFYVNKPKTKIRVTTKFDRMKGYSQSDFDDIVARVAVHKKNNSKTHGATYDVFNVITVNEEITLTNAKDDEEYEYAFGYEFGKMFPRYRDPWMPKARKRSLKSYSKDDLDMGDQQSDLAMAKYEDDLDMLDYTYQIPVLLDDYDFDEEFEETADRRSILVYTTESQ